MERKTKIIATIGPSTIDIVDEISKHVDVLRVNLAHGNDEQRLYYLKKARETKVPILADLPGLKLRIGKLESPIVLRKGDKISFGDKIPINPLFFKLVKEGDIVLISDGVIKIKIINKGENFAEGIVEDGGMLTSGKGVNLRGVMLPFNMREEDLRLAKMFKNYVDFFGLSYVTSVEEIRKLRDIVNDIWIVSKIETRVTSLKEIIAESDAVMIARGDLGVEVGLENLPLVQSRIIRISRKFGKPVILATQVLESMVSSPQPTRAEVIDVSNSVLNGVDAILLSDETAIGSYPLEAVKTLDLIIRSVERNFKIKHSSPMKTYDDAIAYAAVAASELSKSRAILIFSRTGSSVMRIVRLRPKAKVIAFTYHKIARKLSLVWGVTPIKVPDDISFKTTDDLFTYMKDEVLKKGYVKAGDSVVLVHGTIAGRTDTLRVAVI
jgi:pyruvate kinase